MRKTDLIQLLGTPLIRNAEVADLIRRNCLAFRPTERDWADLRAMGASAEVISSVAGCRDRGTAPTVSSTPALRLAVLEPRVMTGVGTEAVTAVRVFRGVVGQPRFTLTLGGTTAAAEAVARDVRVASNDSGLALFRFPVGLVAGVHRLEVRTVAGAALPGRPTIELVVRPGSPALLEVDPASMELGPFSGAEASTVVTVRDSFGNALEGELVELAAATADLGLAPLQRETDPQGRAVFVLSRTAVRQGGNLAIRVRGGVLGTARVVLADTLSATATGFVSGVAQWAFAGATLAEPLVFEARSVVGAPLPGRTVRFRGLNVRVEPDSAVTDSAGRASVAVTIGEKATNAVVTASLGLVEKQVTLDVRPGQAVEVFVERDGVRVDGGTIVVQRDVPFRLTLRARDAYGNATSTSVMARALGGTRGRFNLSSDQLRLLLVEPDSLATILTIKPVALGEARLSLGAGGVTTSLWIKVVRRTE